MPKPTSLEPTAEPEYRTHAVIHDGMRLFNAVPQNFKEVAHIAGHHVNTVSNQIKGSRGQYHIVHDTFTALNILGSGDFSRTEHVHYVEEDGSVHKDDALDHCAVLYPKLRERMIKLKIDAKRLGDSCNVPTRYVNYMLNGRPVARNLVVAVLEAIRTRLAELNPPEELPNDEIIG